MMDSGAATSPAAAVAAGAPPPERYHPTLPVAPGKEFTRTSKGLVVLILAAHLVLRIFPASLDYLAIIPARTIPFIWTIFTAGYVEQVLPGAIGNSLGILFCGKDLEPVWGRKEFLRFIILVNILTGICAFVFAIALYYVTGQESFLYTPLSGFHGCLVAFLVGLKQLLPNFELPMCFFWKIKAKWMPLFVLVFSSVMAVIVPESINFLPTLVSGTYIGWLYLRYFQKNPFTGFRGDPSDDFSFSSFFPSFLSPVLDPVANVFHRVFCCGARLEHAPLPISDPTKASRRRERGERVLEERLAAEKATVASTGVLTAAPGEEAAAA